MNEDQSRRPYEALLVVSFGGPEGPDEVLPFLENVLRGRKVPRQRMLEVAHHYQQFGGVSPLNQQNRQLVAALERLLNQKGPPLPVYWGNRNWHPFLADTLRQMTEDGIRCALAFVTSAYSCYSCCRQYREDIERARQQAGEKAPRVDKLRVFFNHPGFIEPNIEHVRQALEQIPAPRRASAHLVFTAHSIPLPMAENSRYREQLFEVSRLVAEGIPHLRWQMAYQSRSGPPHQPWLEPDLEDSLRALKGQGVQDVVLAPIGFISDHMEVVYDLDTEARQLCQDIGLNMVRAATVGTHPRFVEMIRELVNERMDPRPGRLSLGKLGPAPDDCPANCCLNGEQRFWRGGPEHTR